MIIGPFTLSRGALTPYTEERSTRQSTRTAADGSVTVVDQVYARETFFRAKVRLPKEEADTIVGYLTDGVGFARDTLSLTDAWGIVHTVRFWDRKIKKRVISANLVELDLLFREEVTAP
jgi:hypothetical protein